MSDTTERKVSFEKFTYKDALRVLPNWHATSRPISPVTGDFQLRLDLENLNTIHHGDDYSEYRDWLCLNVYKDRNLAFLSEHRNGYISPVASEITFSLVNEVTIKVDPKNPEKSELIFESENQNYSISNGGLKHEVTKKDGELILNREFETIPLLAKSPEGNVFVPTRER